MVVIERIEVSDSREGLLKIAVLKKNLDSINKVISAFSKRDVLEYFTYEDRIALWVAQLNLDLNIFTDMDMRISYDVREQFVEATGMGVINAISPRNILFEKLAFVKKTIVIDPVTEVQKKGNLLILDGGKRVVIKKQKVVARELKRKTLHDFVREYGGALTIIAKVMPKETRKLIFTWKKYWNRNAQRNYKSGKRNIKYYEYPLSEENYDELMKGFARTIYLGILNRYMAGENLEQFYESALITELICKATGVDSFEIERFDTLSNDELLKVVRTGDMIVEKYALYQGFVDEVLRGVRKWQGA